MQAAETLRPGWRSGSTVVAAAVAIGALVAAVSFTQQLGLVIVAMASIAAVLATRVGLVVNPAWFVVLALFSINTLDEILDTVGLTVQLVVLIAAAPVPFVLGALAIRDRPPLRLWLLSPLLILLIYAVLSLAWSGDRGYGVEKVQLWVLTGLLPVVWMFILVTKGRSISWRVIGLAGLLYAVSLLVFGIQTQLYPGRQVLFDENPIWAARALFVAALAIAFGPFPWWVKIGAVPLIVAAGATTDSLGPALGLAFGLWAGALVWIHRAGWAKAGVILIGGVLGAALLAATLAVIAADADNGSRVLSDFANDPNVTSRAYYYDVAIRLFAASPLGGVGAGGYGALGPDLYPHNMVLEIAAEFGLVGLVLFSAWVVLAIRGAVTSPVLAALLAATLLYTLFSGSIASNAEFWIFSAMAVAAGARPVAPSVSDSGIDEALPASGISPGPAAGGVPTGSPG